MLNNKKAAVPLIWIVISIGAFVFMFSLIISGYGGFISNNGGTLDSGFIGNYYNISHQTDYYTDLSSKEFNFLDTMKTFVEVGIFSGLNIGIKAIRELFSGAKLATDIIETTQTVYPWAGTLIAFLVFAITIYISYKFLQVIRGQAVEI